MKRIALVVGCLWSLCAWAQDEFVLAADTNPTQPSWSFGEAKCGDTVKFRWTYVWSINGTPNDALEIWASALGPCGEQAAPGDQRLTSVPWQNVLSLRTGTFDVRLAELPMFDGGTCPEQAAMTPICASMPYFANDLGTTQYLRGSTAIIFDAEPPATPIITGSAGLDRAIQIKFVSPNDASMVAIEVSAPGDPAFYRLARAPGAAAAVSATNLSNGVEYRARLVAIDDAGNESAPTEAITVSPIALEREVPNGEPKQSCSTAPQFVFALAALWLRRRRVTSR